MSAPTVPEGQPIEHSEDVEVLPPERLPRGRAGGRDGRHHALSQLISYFMDNLLRVPGTGARVGLNPVLDLLPGIGDGAATVLQALTIVEAARRKVPKIVLSRMALNVLLNGAVGMLPVVGEIFTFWFRPSSRNYDLLLKHAPQDAPVHAQPRRNTMGEWIFVVGLLAVVLGIMAVFIAAGIYILRMLWNARLPLPGA